MVSCHEEVVPDAPAKPAPMVFVATDIGESLLATAYLRMELEGLLPIVYHESVPSLSEFLSYHNKEKKHAYYDHYLGAFARPTLDSAPMLVGMGWLGGITGAPGVRKGEVGFVFFRHCQANDVPMKATRLMIDYCFNVAGVDMLVGTTPVKNRAACVFDRKLGFTQLPPIPKFCMFEGQPCDAVISYLSKESWNGTA